MPLGRIDASVALPTRAPDAREAARAEDADSPSGRLAHDLHRQLERGLELGEADGRAGGHRHARAAVRAIGGVVEVDAHAHADAGEPREVAVLAEAPLLCGFAGRRAQRRADRAHAPRGRVEPTREIDDREAVEAEARRHERARIGVAGEEVAEGGQRDVGCLEKPAVPERRAERHRDRVLHFFELNRPAQVAGDERHGKRRPHDFQVEREVGDRRPRHSQDLDASIRKRRGQRDGQRAACNLERDQRVDVGEAEQGRRALDGDCLRRRRLDRDPLECELSWVGPSAERTSASSCAASAAADRITSVPSCSFVVSSSTVQVCGTTWVLIGPARRPFRSRRASARRP